MRKQVIKIGDLQHELVLCSADDIITDGTLALKRTAKVSTWAKIELKKKSQFNFDGQTIDKDRSTVTHKIYIRHSTDRAIRLTAWLFENRGESPDRWFKVISLDDFTDAKGTQFLCLECRHVESADDLVRPVQETAEPEKNILSPLGVPEGVEL